MISENKQTKFPHVYRNNNGTYSARINIAGRRVGLGTRSTQEEAYKLAERYIIKYKMVGRRILVDGKLILYVPNFDDDEVDRLPPLDSLINRKKTRKKE